jgi:hypothetical protein
MTTTEKQAKFLFCPLLTQNDGKLRFCQASQCMMWRWTAKDTGESAEGFCGLASAPVAMAKAVASPGFLSNAAKKEADSPFD